MLRTAIGERRSSMSINIGCCRVMESPLGYTRISTTARDAQFQLDTLFSVEVAKRGCPRHVTSGSKITASRPGMQKLLDHAELGDTVVVWGIDRLGRALIDVLNTVNMMRGASIVVRSISDRIDRATSTGRLMLNILAALAGYEGELIVERVNAGIDAARQSGTRFGRPLSGPTFTRRRLSWLVRLERLARPHPGCDLGRLESSMASPPLAKLRERAQYECPVAGT